MQLLIFISLLFSSVIFSRKLPHETHDIYHQYENNFESTTLDKIGDNPPPGDPMNDRAKGYLLDGKIKSSILNYGNFIDWSSFPAGLWGNYAYLPHVGFMAGVPGHIPTSEFYWESITITLDGISENLWISSDAYQEWFGEIEDKFVDIAYNIINDNGEFCNSVNDIDFEILNTLSECVYQINHIDEEIYLFLNTDYNNPNLTNSRVGLVYPWGKRPGFVQRFNDFDRYDYGYDQQEWTDDDNYEFFGYSVSESWFSEGFPMNTDWQPVNKSRENTHNSEFSSGDIFGSSDFTDAGDSYPVLAHSKYSSTWPVKYNIENGKYEPFWPGWYAKDYFGDQPNKWSELGIQGGPSSCASCCDGTRQNKNCWKESQGKFISDNDVYLEFDDRWAHRGNLVNNNEYQQRGYPLGLRVMAEAHSYGVEYAEDIMFVTVNIRNESGSWVDEDGVYHEAMIMPDGTQLNGGKGFDYERVFLGFYFDSIIVWADYLQNYGVFSNTDDFMEYYWDKIYHDGDSLLISLAMTYDYDGNSNGATDIGVAAAQLLDTPLATDHVDLNKDGIIDIYPGEPLKMTDWHWFDWYNRPGVVERESGTNCCAGYPGRPQARNKEAIHYKIMSGDTTNLSSEEKRWFFHTANPSTDSDYELNPHFDSLDGLKEEPVFSQGQEGFDCIFIMSSGPFDLKVGETVPFSFSIIFGEDKDDLIANAEFAQLMYNSNYQGFTPPTTPTVEAISSKNKIILRWNDASLFSKDALTGYSDFEGFKIYRSNDGGISWGGPKDKIYNQKGEHVGWQPLSLGCHNNPFDIDQTINCEYNDIENCLNEFDGQIRDSNEDGNNDCYWKYAQFDLSAKHDSLFCIKGLNNNLIGNNKSYLSWSDCTESENDPSNCCNQNLIRGINISGPDPNAPWYSLGKNTGFEDIYNDSLKMFEFIDSTVTNGFEYTYAVTAYDMGISGAILNPNSFNNGDETLFTIDTLYIANPEKWSRPNGYKSIESPKGTTTYDSNFITIVPTNLPQNDMSNIKVVPNPYIAQSNFYETEYIKKLYFTNLPAKCDITIYTVNGEKIISLEHDSFISGDKSWDLRTINNQEISPGLYIFSVTTDTEKYIGKFAIIR